MQPQLRLGSVQFVVAWAFKWPDLQLAERVRLKQQQAVAARTVLTAAYLALVVALIAAHMLASTVKANHFVAELITQVIVIAMDHYFYFAFRSDFIHQRVTRVQELPMPYDLWNCCDCLFKTLCQLHYSLECDSKASYVGSYRSASTTSCSSSLTCHGSLLRRGRHFAVPQNWLEERIQQVLLRLRQWRPLLFDACTRSNTAQSGGSQTS